MRVLVVSGSPGTHRGRGWMGGLLLRMELAFRAAELGSTGEREEGGAREAERQRRERGGGAREAERQGREMERKKVRERGSGGG